MTYETKRLPLDLKALNEDGTFEGYASKWDIVDEAQDEVKRGAFTKAIQERGAKGVKMFYEHNSMEPIGVWTDLTEDATGLFARGKLLIGALHKARETYALMKEGVLDGLSIGYQVVQSTKDAGRGVRMLDILDLREISAVVFPMLTDARITAVKSDGKSDIKTGLAMSEKEFERLLTRDAGFTRSQALKIMSSGFKSLHGAKRDAGGMEIVRGELRGLKASAKTPARERAHAAQVSSQLASAELAAMLAGLNSAFR